jgi:rubrerythrin
MLIRVEKRFEMKMLKKTKVETMTDQQGEWQMDMRFNTAHVLQIAEGVEQREIDYYVRAADHLEVDELREVCGQLAGWSLRHKMAWAQKRRRFYANCESLDQCPLPEASAMAGLTWFGIRVVPEKKFKSWTRRESVLWEAMQRARDLTTFYEGLKGFAGDREAMLMIDRIISEEARHLEFIEWLLYHQSRTVAQPA